MANLRPNNYIWPFSCFYRGARSGHTEPHVSIQRPLMANKRLQVVVHRPHNHMEALEGNYGASGWQLGASGWPLGASGWLVEASGWLLEASGWPMEVSG